MLNINQIKKDRSIILVMPSTRYIYRMKCPLMYSKAQRIQEILHRITTMRAPRHLLKINYRSKFTEEKKNNKKKNSDRFLHVVIDRFDICKKKKKENLAYEKNKK